MILFLHHSSGFSVPRPLMGLMRIHWVMGQESSLKRGSDMTLWRPPTRHISYLFSSTNVPTSFIREGGKNRFGGTIWGERGSRAWGGGDSNWSLSGILYWIGVLAVRCLGAKGWCTPLIRYLEVWVGWRSETQAGLQETVGSALLGKKW